MKKLILQFLFLFYHYYDKGSTKSIAYFSALTALIMVIFLNSFAMIIYFDFAQRNPDYSSRTPMSIKYLIGFIIFIPIFFILKKIFKKENILKIEMDKSTMRKGYFIIVSYIILSLFMLIYIIQNK